MTENGAGGRITGRRQGQEGDKREGGMSESCKDVLDQMYCVAITRKRSEKHRITVLYVQQVTVSRKSPR